MEKFFSYFLLVMFLPAYVFADTYYVSSSGSDTNNGTSVSTPWQTLTKVNSTTFVPGDSILFKRGDVFYGSFSAHGSGTTGNVITYGAYGTGNKPVITGFVTLSSWSDLGGGIWEATCSSCGASLNMVTIDGTAQALGRWPNVTAANKGYLSFESHSGTTTITDSQLSGLTATNWTGAELVIRKNRWTLDRNIISQQSGNTLTYAIAPLYSYGSPYVPIDNYGYFIQNDPRTLDQFGEWYYNGSTKKLQLYFGADNPAAHTIQASAIDTLITIPYENYLSFADLALVGSNKLAFKIQDTQHGILDGVDISYSGLDALWGGGVGSLTIQNSTFTHTNNDAIALYNATDTTISNNTITDTGMLVGMGNSGYDTYQGITVEGSSTTNFTRIDGNTITDTGYNPIRFHGKNVTVQHNIIDGFQSIMNDGAAIYSMNANDGATNRVVTANIISNGIGAPEGTSSSSASVHGIYLDNSTANVSLTNNVIFNVASSGIYLNNDQNITVTGNTVFNNGAQIEISHDPNTTPGPTGLTITGNVLYSKTATQSLYTIDTTGYDVDTFGTINNNTYKSPFSTIVTSLTNVSNGYQVTNYTFDQWKTAYGFDAGTTATMNNIGSGNPDDYLRFEYNNTGSDKTVSLGSAVYADQGGTLRGNSLVVSPYSAAILQVTNYAAPTVSMVVPAGTLSGTVSLDVSLTNTANVASVQYLLDGAPLGSPISSAPYTTSLDTTGVGDGSHTISAQVIDAIGSTINAVAASVTIQNTVIPPTATTFTVTGPTSGTVNTASANFTVTPNNAYTGTITITPSGGGLSTPIVLTFAGSSAPQTFSITPTTAGTVTLTPTNNGSLTNPAALSYTVSVANSGGGGGSSGGGGGSSSGSSSHTSSSGSSVIKPTQPIVQQPIPTPYPVSGPIFNTYLVRGMQHDDVRRLQQYLNAQGFTVSTTGNGSTGNETTYFGPATATALTRFQIAHGISGTGTLGPITRAAIAGSVITTNAASTPSPFMETLRLGMRSEYVRKLQQYLNTHGYMVATTGSGSPGSETTYFGPATQAALIRFQTAHAIPSTGIFGPLTRAVIQL